MSGSLVAKFGRKTLGGLCVSLGAFSNLEVPGGVEAQNVSRNSSLEGAVLHRTIFKAIDRSPMPQAEAGFALNSRAKQLHENINAKIRSGQGIAESDLKSLFSALANENMSGLGDGFFVAYARKFNSAEAVQAMMAALIPVVDSRPVLQRGERTVHILRALRALGGSFPNGTSVELRRDFFQSFHKEKELGVRALGLMLCLNANIKPTAVFSAPEIVRASQFLSAKNRLIGYEAFLGRMLSQSLIRSQAESGFGGDAASLVSDTLINSIGLPLLRRGQIAERRNPGITEALEAGGAYPAYLFEHARRIAQFRQRMEGDVLLGEGVNFYALQHSAPEFHFGPVKDIAKAFRLTYDPNSNRFKGQAKAGDGKAKAAYLKLLGDSVANKGGGGRNVIWLDAHGTTHALFLVGGEHSQVPAVSKPLGSFDPAHYILFEEEATAISRGRGLDHTWFIVDTCLGWNYVEQVNEKVIEGMINRVRRDDKEAVALRIPGRITVQNGMLSAGYMLPWSDGADPNSAVPPERVSFSIFMLELLRHCQAKALNVPKNELRSIGPSAETAYTCTMGDVLEVDTYLQMALQDRLNQLMTTHEGRQIDPSAADYNYNYVDPSVQAPQLTDPDREHLEFLKVLEQKGFQISPPRSSISVDARAADWVNEVSVLFGESSEFSVAPCTS